MAADLTVVIFVTVGHLASPATAGMTEATKTTLGPSTKVQIEEVEEIPSDDEAVLLGDMLESEAVAEVRWPDAKFDRAEIRLYARARGEWFTREVKFQPSDAESERGRTVGFALASMIPDRVAEPPSPPVSPPKAPPRVVPSPTPPTDIAPVRPARPSSFALDAAISGSSTTGESALGARLGARWSLGAGWSIRGAGAFSSGHVAAASARMLDVWIASGVGFESRPLLGGLRLGGRLEMALVRSDLSRESATGGTEHSVRYLPATTLAGEIGWPLFGPLDGWSAVGAEVIYGTTRIFVRDQQVAKVSPLRLLAELGLRLRF